MKTIYVIYGSQSTEHAVSVNSAKNVMNALDKDKYRVIPVYITKSGYWMTLPEVKEEIGDVKDIAPAGEGNPIWSMGEFLRQFERENAVVFPVLHGTNGEDGTMQGFLDLMDVPYVGNGTLSSAVTFHKGVCNDLFAQHGIPQAKYLEIHRCDYDENAVDVLMKIEETLDFPIYVKPCNAGSSVGITPVYEEEQLEDALKLAFTYDHDLVLEEEVDGPELQLSVIGNDRPVASLPGEYPRKGFFDYNEKYKGKKLEAIIPARLSEDRIKEIQDLAVAAYQSNRCCGLARVDIFVTKDGDFLVNEINTIPGMSASSMTPKLWGPTNGTDFPHLVDLLIGFAEERYEQKKRLLRSKDDE